MWQKNNYMPLILMNFFDLLLISFLFYFSNSQFFYTDCIYRSLGFYLSGIPPNQNLIYFFITKLMASNIINLIKKNPF